MIDSAKLKSQLSPSDYRRLFRRCGFDINGEDGPELSGILGPKELGEGRQGNFSIDLEKGLVKDWGSSGYRGDLFSVIQDVHNLSFPEALEWAAHELGLDETAVQLEENVSNSSDGISSTSVEKSSSPEWTAGHGAGQNESPNFAPVVSHEQVRQWHERLVSKSGPARAARSYLMDERGITEEVLQSARLGLAHSSGDPRATWWVMIPVPDRGSGDPPLIKSVKGFAFDPLQKDWKRDEDGGKIPRNAGPGALYDLVPSNPLDTPVVVCEGEIDALCALSNGFNAVTGTVGASTFKEEWAEHTSNLTPAEEHGVVVAFDGDEAGREGGVEAAERLSEAGVEVQVASLPEGKDVNDVLMEGGIGELRSCLSRAEHYTSREQHSDAVDRGDSSRHEAQYKPFPIEALPGPIQEYVRASARALGEQIPHAMVAVPTLSVLSGAIGDAVQLELKRSWTETATLWTVVVAPSGSTKSPAFSHAVRPVFRRESRARDKYKKALKRWENQEEPDPKAEPTRDRYRTGDATPESVVKILEENPRGVLLARDELGAWLGSFDRYVNGAADLQFWVEVWQGFQASRDRAGDGNTTIDTPTVPVTGTIQPGTIREKLDEIHFDTGFAARLILCSPPTPPKRWTEADVSLKVKSRYETVLDRLYNRPRGQTVSLKPAAKDMWVEYYNNANAALEMRPEGPAKAAAAKGITHTARLALVLHLCRKASEETDSREVDGRSMEAALQLGKWLTGETLRVYRSLDLEENAFSPVQRFLRMLPDEFETKEAKEIANAEDIPDRTCDKWLSDLVESSDLVRVKRGLYRKQ